MQVTDSPAPAAASTVGKDEVRSAGDEPARSSDRGHSGKGFRDTLERKRRAPAGGDGAPEDASAAAMMSWFRPEPGRISATAIAAGPAAGAGAVSGARALDRVLIGSGPDGAQARIRIGAGALAGTEIQLSSVTGSHAVEARLLTHAAASRQTLSVVMDEIRSRLRGRGIALSIRPGAPSPPAAQGDDTNATVGDPPGSSPGGAAGVGR